MNFYIWIDSIKMKKKNLLIALIALAFLGITSCAQQLCPAYAKVDTVELKKEAKKEGQF